MKSTKIKSNVEEKSIIHFISNRKPFVNYSSSFRSGLCVCILYACMQQFGSESSKVLMVINEWWAGPINTLFKTVFEDLAMVCQFISHLGFNI